MWHLILEIQTLHTDGHSGLDGSWKTDDGWMNGGQIWIALESSSGVSSKDVTSVSVSHLIWRGNNAFKKGEVPEPKWQIK
jgi:hypothetical protein